jgi:hypothetical protein
MQDNHLQLFEFVGRMLGKAVYEVIFNTGSRISSSSKAEGHAHSAAVTAQI